MTAVTTTTAVVPEPVVASDSMLVILARLEGKVDANLAGLGRDVHTLKGARDDHEVRLRSIEARSTVSARQLWAGLAGTVAVAAGLVGIVTSLANYLPS